MMKKHLLVIALLFFCVFHLFAQDQEKELKPALRMQRHEINLNVGFGVNPQRNMYESFYKTEKSFDEEILDVLTSPFLAMMPVLGVGYTFHINQRMNVGLVVNTDFSSFHSLMAEYKINYIAKEKFTFGGKINLGATMVTGIRNKDTEEQITRYMFSYGVYPIAFSFGRRGGATVELGYGCKGFINAGGYFRF